MQNMTSSGLLQNRILQTRHLLHISKMYSLAAVERKYRIMEYGIESIPASSLGVRGEA